MIKLGSNPENCKSIEKEKDDFFEKKKFFHFIEFIFLTDHPLYMVASFLNDFIS